MRKIKVSGGLFALCSDRDYKLVSKYTWCAQKRKNGFHAATYIGKKYTYMHRLILKALPHQLVDHRDRNGLNNTRRNIRICDKSQNSMNAKLRATSTTGYCGVSRNTSAKESFRAYITVRGRTVHLGCATTAEGAAKIRLLAAKKYHRNFVPKELSK